MRLSLFMLISISILSQLGAQPTPLFLGEDNDENSGFNIECLCRPGVQNKSRSRGLEISYLRNQGGVINPEDVPFTGAPSNIDFLKNLTLNLKIPLINKEGFKLLAGFNYRTEQYNFDRIGPDYEPIFQYLNQLTLKNSGIEVFATKSLNEKHYLVMRLKTSSNGDYSGLMNFGHKYRILNATAVYGIKKNEDLEYGFGLTFTHSFRTTIALPFFVYNRNFNSKWGFESVLPALAMVRYNTSPKNILLGGVRFNSRSYSLNLPDSASAGIYEMNHSEIRLLLSMEQNLVPWVWLDTEVGYQVNFSTDFEVKANRALDFKVEPNNALYLKIGIFISPPDSFLK